MGKCISTNKRTNIENTTVKNNGKIKLKRKITTKIIKNNKRITEKKIEKMYEIQKKQIYEKFLYYKGDYEILTEIFSDSKKFKSYFKTFNPIINYILSKKKKKTLKKIQLYYGVNFKKYKDFIKAENDKINEEFDDAEKEVLNHLKENESLIDENDKEHFKSENFEMNSDQINKKFLIIYAVHLLRKSKNLIKNGNNENEENLQTFCFLLHCFKIFYLISNDKENFDVEEYRKYESNNKNETINFLISSAETKITDYMSKYHSLLNENELLY